MIEEKPRLRALTTFLSVMLAINIVVTIISIVTMMLTGDAYLLYACSVCSVASLFNSVGLTLLMRWHSNGLWLILPVSIVACVCLAMSCEGWLKLYLGVWGIIIPALALMFYVGGLLVLINVRYQGTTAYRQMDVMLDWTHFRHIYQLSCAIMILIFVTTIARLPNMGNLTYADVKIAGYVPKVSVERLDATDVSIEEVLTFEKDYNRSHSPSERDGRVTRRILALKHLLLCALMPQSQYRESIEGICKNHTGDFSRKQQLVLSWYLSLDSDDRDEWALCNGAESIDDFKAKLQQRMR